MNRGVEIRHELMKSAIRVTSEQGLQNVTTKALSMDSGFSEVYIYRYFRDKEDLLSQTFNFLDKELMYVMYKSLKTIDQSYTNVSSGFKLMFHDVWQFCLGDKDKCSFFIQYYYSHYYLKHSEEKRKEIYQPLLELISKVFGEKRDVWGELNHMYDVIFPRLLRVIRGLTQNVPELEESAYKELILENPSKCI